ncbi:glycosyltransferase family 4 protein [Kocuria sp. CPCC 205300]|uniref:glycosyltransferase family 4 protein n=1 Tax=Kocuria sabuli TaxID=3071448 RepID=UPI0036DE250C
MIFKKREGATRRPLRLLVISPWGVSGGYSGPLVLQNRLLSSLVTLSSDVQVTVLYRDRGMAELPVWAHEPVPVVTAPPESFPKARQLAWLAKTVLYVLRHRHRFDAVFLQGMYLHTCFPALFLTKHAKVIALPVVDGGDLARNGQGIKNTIKSRMQSILLARTILGISLSTGIQKDLIRLGVPEASTILAYNLVDTDVYRPGGGIKGTGSNFLDLVFVGALGPRKQPHIMVEVCDLLRKRGIEATVTFVGPFESAAYESEIGALVERLKLSDVVRFVGLSEFPLRYFQEASMFVLPSRSEGMPGAMSEAMACGLPVVVSSVGAMPQVVEAAECGVVVENFDVASWVDAIEKLRKTPIVMHEMSANGRAFAQKHMKPDAVADVIIDFIGS